MALMTANEWAVFFLYKAIGALWAGDYGIADYNIAVALDWLKG